MPVVNTDPGATRMLVLAASGVLAAVGAYWIADAFQVEGEWRFGNPVPEPPQPRQVRAEVVRVEGGATVQAGDECLFLVERHDLPDGRFQCRAQISCGGVLLYGGPQRGYFPCAFSGEPPGDVMGADPSTTRTDGDAAMQLDTARGILRVRDDVFGTHGVFAMEAEVLEVR